MTSRKAIVVLAVLIIVGIALQWGNSKTGTSSASVTPTQSWYERLQDPSYREAFASVGMKQIHYLRDPDSLVIESTGGCSRRTIGKTDWLVFACHYRAKNGFGGYTPAVAWVLCDPDNGSFRIMSEAQYDDFWQTEAATPTETKGKRHKRA